MALCKIHPLTQDHISTLATLVSEKIGAMIGDAALKNKVADLDSWYELRRVIAQMQESSGAKENMAEKPARKARTRIIAPTAPEPIIPADTKGDEAGGAE